MKKIRWTTASFGGLLITTALFTLFSSPAFAGEPGCAKPSDHHWAWTQNSDNSWGWHYGPEEAITINVPSWIQVIYWSYEGKYMGAAYSGQIGPLNEATAFCKPAENYTLYLPVVRVAPPKPTPCDQAPSTDPRWHLIGEENGVRKYQIGPFPDVTSFTATTCDQQVDWSRDGVGHSDPAPAGKLFSVHAATVWRHP